MAEDSSTAVLGAGPGAGAGEAAGPTLQADGSPGYSGLDWRAGLPVDLQAKGWLKDVPDVPALAKRADDLLAYQGRSIGVPGKDAKPEDWERVYDRLGRPASPDAYEIANPVGEAGAPWWTPELDSGLKSIAHKVGLNQPQAQKFVEEVAQFLHTGHNVQEANRVTERQQIEQTMAQQWGGLKEANRQTALKAIERFSETPEDHAALQAWMSETGHGNTWPFIKLLYRVGALLPEDTYVGDGRGPLPSVSDLTVQIATATTAVFDAESKGGGKALETAQAQLKALQQQRAAQLERQQAQRRFV